MTIKEDVLLDPLSFIEDENIRKVIEEGKVNISLYSGAGNKVSRETVANYAKSENEKVFRGPTNSMIILGNDKNSGHKSGFGGKGHGGCATIDIVAGFMGPRPVGTTEYGQSTSHPKDFKNDSSRIYISQMTDIDKYFEIPQIGIF